MDLQTMVNNAMDAARAKEMLNSDQLTMGELILKLESVKDTSLPVRFDDEKLKPTGLGSWRGSYKELAINYEGAQSCLDQPGPDCKMDEYGHDYKCECGRDEKAHSTSLPENPSAQNLLNVLNLAKGKVFEGYKGGDFTMGKTTPVWVANYGESSGFKREGDKYNQAVVDVEETDKGVILKTACQ